MKNKILILSLLLFSVFLIPGNVFASDKVQFEDYSLNFTEEEKQKAIDSILSDSVLNDYSKDEYYYTIFYTAAFEKVSFVANEEELFNNSMYVLLITSKNWSVPVVINTTFRLDVDISKVYYFDDNFYNLGTVESSAYFQYRTSIRTSYNPNAIRFPLLYTTVTNIPNKCGYDLDLYNGDTLIFSLLKNENYLEKYKKYIPPIKYTINSIHKISTIILGEDIPEEFSFVYLITDYLLLLAFVIVVISPFVLIVRILRWS